jgi:DNA polymerase III subunit epsilon
MDFAAIDFETANEKRNSPCAIGLVVAEDGVITKKISRLVKPPTDYFNPFNVSIHGITFEDVKDEPEFKDIFPGLCQEVSVKASLGEC